MQNLYLSKEKIVQTFATLSGLIDGIRADGKIKTEEVSALKYWLNKHKYLKNREPFTQIVSIVEGALEDHILTEDELSDIKYVCRKFLENYGDGPIGTIQGMASGISSDKELHESEWDILKKWISSNRKLKGAWPYDEIEAVVTKHLSATKLTPDEATIIIKYFNDFCGLNRNSVLTHPLNEPGQAITGICAVCPEIELEEKVFCITGESERYPRKEISDLIATHGGYYKRDLSGLVDYLVVCNAGSPMWIYSCYGRKIENAIAMRKQGHRIQIINEFDLWDHFEEVA